MFLKKIEIYGFKSFAEKATIDFSKGTSAIIGPNGCGKSNIIDAIRWTLGEQSVKTLRGGRMEDIIFSGSEKRKPLNFAEVSLRFEDVDNRLNFDYTEMEITRRLYRSGESEYFINKTSCRLKDINELFMDTGIGKEVYSIVGQNRVEEIIVAKPEERRELIEEAAGILKYKHRKREAHRRLDDMRGNLQRVCDLIYELENQMEPLKEQADIARKYKELKSHMKDNERMILNYRIGINKRAAEKVTEKLTNIQDETVNTISVLTETVKAIESLQKQMDEVTEKRNILEREINTFLHEKEQIESRTRLLEERERNFLKQKEENTDSINNLEKRSCELFDINENREEQLKEKIIVINDLNESIENLKQKNELYKNDNSVLQIEKLQQDFISTTSRREALDSTLIETDYRKTNIKKQIIETENQTGIERSKIAANEEKNKVLEEGKENKRAVLENLLDELKLNELKLKKCREEIGHLKLQTAIVKEELSSHNNKLWLLKKLDDEKTPLQKGAEELLNSDYSDKGVLGSIFSIIEVPPQFRLAIEAALGEKVFGVLTSDEDMALRAINHLKNNQKGWTTIFPVNLIKKLQKDSIGNVNNLSKIPGVTGLALDLVKVDANYYDIAEWLLGNIVVTENLETALAAARETDYAIYAVTTEGDTVYPGGIIRGGNDDKEKSLHWNKEEEIKSLEMIIPKCLDKKERIENEIANLQGAENNYQGSIEVLKKQEEKVKKEIDVTEREEALLSKEKEYLESNIDKLNRTLESLTEEEKSIDDRRNTLKQSINEVEDKRASILEKLEGLKGEYRHLLEDRDSTTNMLTQQQIEYNKNIEQKNYLLERIQQTKDESGKIEDAIDERNNKNKEFDKLLTELEASKREEIIKIDFLARDSKEKSIEYENVKNAFNALLGRKTELEKEEQNLKNKRHKLERNSHRFEIEKTRIQAERDHQVNLFKDKFGVSPEFEEDISDLNESEVIENLERIKEDIERMGHVRVGAIEEMERLTERVAFLQSQEEDLKKGEESLKEILNEIDDRIKLQFNEAMEQIRDNFKVTYVELFGGGQALIRFTDPDNILESGVEIDAQPPGKNLKNISLLSSGEKALTAIALLFAIFKFKPAPFYFLDEIESSLDDSNLDKFTDFMGKASQMSQFILITHRRKTMEKANLVYGVTMPESGVSRIISLKLDKKAS